MREYSHINELLADAPFEKSHEIWGYLDDQNVDVMRFDSREYIRWDFILRNGKDIHFQECAKFLSIPGVLSRHKDAILRAVQKAEKQ